MSTSAYIRINHKQTILFFYIHYDASEVIKKLIENFIEQKKIETPLCFDDGIKSPIVQFLNSKYAHTLESIDRFIDWSFESKRKSKKHLLFYDINLEKLTLNNVSFFDHVDLPLVEFSTPIESFAPETKKVTIQSIIASQSLMVDEVIRINKEKKESDNEPNPNVIRLNKYIEAINKTIEAFNKNFNENYPLNFNNIGYMRNKQ